MRNIIQKIEKCLNYKEIKKNQNGKLKLNQKLNNYIKIKKYYKKL